MCRMLLVSGLIVMAWSFQPRHACGQHASLRIAMCQTEIVDGDLAENMRRAESAIREAAKQRADLACLPEAADWGWLYEHARHNAFPVPGKYTNYLSKIAAELKIWVCAGCLEKDDDKTYNSAVLIDRTGKIVLKHRKINTLKSLTEMLYDPGVEEEIKVVDTELGRVGITVACSPKPDPGVMRVRQPLGYCPTCGPGPGVWPGGAPDRQPRRRRPGKV